VYLYSTTAQQHMENIPDNKPNKKRQRSNETTEKMKKLRKKQGARR